MARGLTEWETCLCNNSARSSHSLDICACCKDPGLSWFELVPGCASKASGPFEMYIHANKCVALSIILYCTFVQHIVWFCIQYVIKHMLS